MTNLLPLETFRRILGWHPFHFFGLADTGNAPKAPVRSQCDDLLKQYAWQDTDRAGRAEIALAIESAERLLRDYLGFAVAPEYREVTIPWPRFYDTARTRYAAHDAAGRWIAPLLPFGCGELQALGVEALTLRDTVTKSDPPVGGDDLVFTDADGDGLYDTFTATATVPSDTEAADLAVYFASADRLDGESAGERWRIRPVTISVSGTTATIKGRLWLLVRPIEYEGLGTVPLDPSDLTAAGPYAQSLEVYTRVTDPTGTTAETAQAKVIWETAPFHGWWCGCGCSSPTLDPSSSPLDPAAIAYAVARATIRDARSGRVGIGEAVYNATSGVWAGLNWSTGREPDRVTVRLLAGAPLEDGNMARAWQPIVARLAMAELGRPVAACETANRELFRWQQDVALVDGRNEEKYSISDQDLDNPFGTRRGHIFAWRQVKHLALTPATIDS